MKLTADKFISPREEERLFAAIEKEANAGDKAAMVDYMLFSLLQLTGMRISEALNLKWDDIRDDFILIHDAKSGAKTESVFIGKRLIALIDSFSRSNPYPHSPFVFNTQKGPYKRTNAHERLKHWLKKAKLRDSISCHSFRHTYATKSLNAGLPLTMVRDQLRHSSISVTSAYLHFSEENKEKLKDIF